MCNGPIFPKLIRFIVPLMLSGFLQLLFNAADTVVVGRFTGNTALAAVGATGPLINLLVNLFMNISVGTNVLVARAYGKRDAEGISSAVHTSILFAFATGVVMIGIGFAMAKTFLVWMGTPGEVLPEAELYTKIYFIGIPVNMLYNFGAAILRAVGDTRRPLYYLTFAGAVNVILNLILVVLFHLGVAGVAAATVVSQLISAGLVINCLARSDGAYRLDFKRLQIRKKSLMQIIRVGLPAGLQSLVFNISNILIQSSINSFGAVAMAGSTAAANVESFEYMINNSCSQAALSFTSQNMGAGKRNRIDKILLGCLGIMSVFAILFSVAVNLFGGQILGIYTQDPQVIAFGSIRFLVIGSGLLLCGIMDQFPGVLRGLGYSILPMMVTLTGACLLRIVWLYTVFQWIPTLDIVFASYPVTWGVTSLAYLVCYLVIRKKKKLYMGAETE